MLQLFSRKFLENMNLKQYGMATGVNKRQQAHYLKKKCTTLK